MITFGILVAYCISIGTRNINTGGASWRIVVMLNCLWALILGIGFLFAPESPRWLFYHGRTEDAEKSLARIRGVKVEDNDYSVRTAYYEMEEAVKREKRTKQFGWIDCFQVKDKILCKLHPRPRTSFSKDIGKLTFLAPTSSWQTVLSSSWFYKLYSSSQAPITSCK
jgi:hypothetical protein